MHDLDNDLLFFLIEKAKQLVANLHDKTEYAIHIKNLKQALNLSIVLKKVNRVIKFNQEAWLKPHIDMNTDLRKAPKNDFFQADEKVRFWKNYGKCSKP